MDKWDDVTLSEKTSGYFVRGIKALWELSIDQKINIIAIAVVILLGEALNLSFFYVLKLLLDEIGNMSTGSVFSTQAIIFSILFGLTLIISLTLNRFVRAPIFLKSLIYLENEWPIKAQRKLLELSANYHDAENTGKIISKINKGCEKLVNILVAIFDGLLPALLYLCMNVVLIFLMDWRLGLLFFAPILPALLINMKQYEKFTQSWEEWEKKKEYATGLFCQSLLNIPTVQGYAQEKNEEVKLGKVRKQMYDIDIKASLGVQQYLYYMGLILYGFFVITVLVGAYLVRIGDITVGTITYISVTGMITLNGFWQITNSYVRMMRDMVATLRMSELMKEKVDVLSPKNGIILKKFIGNFKFDNVSFNYPHRDNFVLKNFTAEIPEGSMTAFVATTGGGKSTAISLLSRVRDVTNGQIMLDGIDIRKFDRNWYRRLFATVYQEVGIFDTTLRENISYGYPEASDYDVDCALRAAHLDKVVRDNNRFPSGLDTQVGERGIRLSGGERQRVGIAQAYLALLRGAKVLILDEATSSLDSETEYAIQEMINNLRKNTPVTVVAIAHRLSTIRQADNIYVLEDGQVVESGDHGRLMQGNGLYKRLVTLQQSGNLRD